MDAKLIHVVENILILKYKKAKKKRKSLTIYFTLHRLDPISP